MSILHHIPTKLRHAASTRGGEWHGPCPFCGGKDRFRAQPAQDFAACRQCGWQGDTIQLLRDLRGLSFDEARAAVGQFVERAPPPLPRPLEPPSSAWQDRARQHAWRCVEALWSATGARALNWLRSRGLDDRTIETACFGFNAADIFDAPVAWGFEGGKRIWLPRGITIPWEIDGQVWDVRVRRSLPPDSDESRYISPRGRRNGLYMGDRIAGGGPVLLCEGEIDTWSAAQAADGLIIPVATGSTCGAQEARWTARLLCASVVLVAFDSDEAGEEAARHWTDRLPNARRWRPYWGDVNQLLQDGADVLGWIKAGLQYNPSSTSFNRTLKFDLCPF